MTALSCPVCQGAMREISREGVLIDTCTQCRGVWLDRGELEKLVGVFERQPETPRGRVVRDKDDRDDDRWRGRDDERGKRRDWDDDDDDDRRRHNVGPEGAPQRSRMSRLLDFFD